MKTNSYFTVRSSQVKTIQTLSVVLLSLLAASPILADQAPDIPEDVKETIRFRVDHRYNVGIIVGVVSPSGTQYYSYGKTALSGNQTPNEDTIFEIGSFTKVFTSVLLADMVERGAVAFDDPIEKHLPSGVQAPKRNGQSITLVHLATHTSGLPRMPNNLTPANLGNPYADYSVEQMYDFLSKHTLNRDIGAQHEYSNYGMGLLGHILALRSGRSYEELVKQRVTNELGMPDTGITLTPEMRDRLAKGYSGGIEVANWDIPTLAGTGALRSTARDMLTFLAANMDLKESRLYSAMRTTHKPRHEAGSSNVHIGLGWHIVTSGDHEVVWHNGGTGGYWSFAGFERAEQKGVVVLTNTNQSIDDIGRHLFDPNYPLREIQALAKPVKVELALDEKLPTGKEIMERCIKCIGGYEALAKLNNRLIKGTMEIKQMGIKGTITAYQARPNKYYAKIEIEGIGTIERGTDGEVVWELHALTGPRVMEGEEKALMLLVYNFDQTNYKKLYKKIECVGMEEIQGEVYYRVVFTPRRAKPLTIYFSRESGLIVKSAFTLEHQLGKIKVETLEDDYKEVDGILYAHHGVEKAMNMDTDITLDSLQHNVEIPEDRFELPLEIKKRLERSKERENETKAEDQSRKVQ